MGQRTDDGRPHWLDLYGSTEFRWQCHQHHGHTRFHRPLGRVESIFDSDGRFWEGRADINNLLELEIRSALAEKDLRQHILLAWACLRCQHLLLQAKAIVQEDSSQSHDVHFVVDLPKTKDQALADAKEHMVFLEDHYGTMVWQDFWRHCQNATRVIDPEKALAEVFVLPLESQDGGGYRLRFLTVGAHQIWDGLTTSTWMRDFTHLLNQNPAQLRERLVSSVQPEGVANRLPLPQEALYPAISGSRPRQRWFWLLTRILRHVRKPLQAGFANPLYRPDPLQPSAMAPGYDKVLEYSRVPPVNTVICPVAFSGQHTQHLHRLCKEAKASVGAGCFALAAISMMEMHELAEPDIPLSERKPFISGFPLNPRAFFDHHVDPDSCMLSFSDGIAMPFLSSDLPFDGRFRMLARQAHRQLAAYQKRPRHADAKTDLQYMGSRGAGRLLATQYIQSLERADNPAVLPAQLSSGINPQGAYPARFNWSAQTCGVSSVGKSMLRPGMYDVNKGDKDLVADFRASYSAVRARPGEFLVGIGGSEQGLWANVSIDASAVDLGLVEVWREKMLHILDEQPGGCEAKL